MKILKYIFLLLLLSFVSFSVFMATQKGNFAIERSKVIHASKENLYNYVNDYQNWGDFMALMVEDEDVNIKYPKITTGKGASCSWEGTQRNGRVQTFSVKENDSITQKMEVDGSQYQLTWLLKDTIGGTKVTLKSKGKMSFSYKIYTAMQGGVDRIIGGLFEKSLANLNESLVYEINTYKIKVKGLVQKLGTPYLKQSFTSKISSIVKNRRIVFPKIIAFCEQNNIEQNGKPFLIYHSYDELSGLAKISLCVPIKKPLMISEGSDIVAEELAPFQAIKTTLYGDYSHNKEALNKTKAYNAKNKITLDSKISHIEVYSISKSDIKNPSKWKTEIYFPIEIKKRVPKAVPKIEPLPIPEQQAAPAEI